MRTSNCKNLIHNLTHRYTFIRSKPIFLNKIHWIDLYRSPQLFLKNQSTSKIMIF